MLTLNQRLRRQNRRVPCDQRNNPPQHPRIVYPSILDINYFRHFLDILQNYDQMDDEPMWAADHVVAPTPGSAITIPETANKFAIKGSSNTNTDKIMARMDAMTIKMDAQYKELQSRAKQPTPDLDDDMPMSREEEAKFMQTFYNPDDQQNNSENPINFDSDDEDDEPTPQPKTQPTKPVKETPLPKPYKPKIPRRKQNPPFHRRTLLEEEIFSKFNKFMEMTADENSESKSDTEEPPFEKITINTDYKIKTSLEEPPMDLELKPLPDNLEYVFLEEPSFLPMIISSKLPAQNKSKLIQLLDDKKPVVQKQRRLNPNMQEVVKKEIVKLLDTGIIYPIANSPWVSLIHCVPNKGGITVVTNENDELVPTRTVMGWRVCIDYHKLNEATAKDHFPLPFMD
ncbi:hypothetical protein Tco_0298737 [Tanacetum coccineum]